MRPRTQKQPQVKKELCRVLDYVNVNVNNNNNNNNSFVNEIHVSLHRQGKGT